MTDWGLLFSVIVASPTRGSPAESPLNVLHCVHKGAAALTHSENASLAHKKPLE